MRPHTARRRVSLLALLAAGMTLLAGCAQSVGVTGADTVARAAAPARGAPAAPQARAAGAAAADIATAEAITGAEGLAPGFYGLDRLTISTSGNTVTIRSQRPCEQVLDELQAGQWAMRAIPADQNPLGTTMALFSYGSRLAMAYLKGGESSCTGSITVANQVDLTAGGSLTAAAHGIELPLYCHVGPDPNGNDLKDLRLTYFGLFTTASGSFVMMLGGPATVGRHELSMSDDDSEGITLLPMKPDVAPIDAALTFLGTFFAGQGAADDAFAQFTGMFYGDGTLTVASTGPLQATLTTGTLSAYDDSADNTDYGDYDHTDDGGQDTPDGTEKIIGAAAGQTLSVTAPLHCAQ